MLISIPRRLRSFDLGVWKCGDAAAIPNDVRFLDRTGETLLRHGCWSHHQHHPVFFSWSSGLRIQRLPRRR